MNDLIHIESLRIRNLLLYKGEVHYVSTLSLDIDDEYQDLIGLVKYGQTSHEVTEWNRALVNDLSPIPLTEEWLVKFGAVKTFENWQFTISVGAITLHFRRSTQWYSELGGIYLGSKIQYVHQLQNLYFALTGNELELK